MRPGHLTPSLTLTAAVLAGGSALGVVAAAPARAAGVNDLCAVTTTAPGATTCIQQPTDGSTIAAGQTFVLQGNTTSATVDVAVQQNPVGFTGVSAPGTYSKTIATVTGDQFRAGQTLTMPTDIPAGPLFLVVVDQSGVGDETGVNINPLAAPASLPEAPIAGLLLGAGLVAGAVTLRRRRSA